MVLSESRVMKDQNLSKETRVLLDILALGERQVEQGLNVRCVKTKCWRTRTGKLKGGKAFNRNAIYTLLKNRVYLGEVFYGDEWLDIGQSVVEVKSLKNWLRQRGIKPSFFFTGDDESPDYLNPAHPRYSRKLAATVTAWLETEDEKLLRGKTAKQALEKWLRENAASYGLSDEDGKPKEWNDRLRAMSCTRRA